MAPVGVHIAGLAEVGSFTPEVFIITSVLLFIVLITLLTICTQCGRHSFELEEGSNKERTPSALIRVVKLEEACETRENPVINDIVKDEQVPSPISENGSVQLPMEITPWRRHTGVGNHQGEASDTPNTSVAPMITDPVSEDANPPATLSFCVPPTSDLAVTSPWEQELALQSAPPTVSTHPPDVVMGGAEQPGPPAENPSEETPENSVPVNGAPENGVPENAASSWQNASGRHTYESLEEVGQAVSNVSNSLEDKEEPHYHTVAELDLSALPPPPLFDTEQGAEPDLPAPPTTDEWEEEGLEGRGFNAMYAQVSKKYSIPSPPSQPPPEEEEEEESAPPIPEKSFELEGNLSTPVQA